MTATLATWNHQSISYGSHDIACAYLMRHRQIEWGRIHV